MAFGRRLGRAFLVTASVLGLALWIIVLLLSAQAAENSDDFGKYFGLIIAVNVVGVSILLFLIGARLVRLIRDYRQFVPGSRLEARVVSLIGFVATIPLVVFYMFAIAFVEYAIDQWFEADAAQGLDDALALSEAAINLREVDALNQVEDIAAELMTAAPDGRAERLAELWPGSDAAQLVLYSSSAMPQASYPDTPDSIVPVELSTAVLTRLSRSLPDQNNFQGFVDLEVTTDGTWEIQALAVLPMAGGDYEVLLGRYPLPVRQYELIRSVEDRHQQLASVSELKTELKIVLVLVISLVLLIAILGSVFAAFFVAQRLISPIQRLMQGTRAVARGDFDTKVPQGDRDEIGFLVSSFNNMTQRLALARKDARDSEQRLEDERSKVEVILANLSTGVIAVEPDLKVRTVNRAAGDILGLDLSAHVGEPLAALAGNNDMVSQFFSTILRHLEAGDGEWQDQITVNGEAGGRELVCACTPLPTEGEQDQPHVIVFDDITVLIQAQREAAWGEVARRLAHEIKNPLTPIQLSAERVRRRYLVEGDTNTDLLDRATHTIIQQVDSMKRMVDAFSEYARAPDIELATVDINELVNEVIELYRHQVPPVAIRMQLEEKLPSVEADIGRMRQVMHNLVRNSSEAIAGQPDAEIDISTQLQTVSGNEYIEILVGDNGPGFAAEIIDRAFLPYVTSKDRGTGLGLAIVRKLIEEHGGRIKASNKAQGGAEVSILIPLSDHGRENDRGRRSQHRRRRA